MRGTRSSLNVPPTADTQLDLLADNDDLSDISQVKARNRGAGRAQRSSSPVSTRMPSESGTLASAATRRYDPTARRANGIPRPDELDWQADDLLEDWVSGDAPTRAEPEADDMLEDALRVGAPTISIEQPRIYETPCFGGFLLKSSCSTTGGLSLTNEDAEDCRGGFMLEPLAGPLSVDDLDLGEEDAGIGAASFDFSCSSACDVERFFAAPVALQGRCLSEDILPALTAAEAKGFELTLCDVSISADERADTPEVSAEHKEASARMCPTPSPPPGGRPRDAYVRRHPSSELRTPTPTQEPSTEKSGDAEQQTSRTESSDSSLAGAAAVALLRVRRLAHR